jgi:hypothetical protein
MFGIERLAQFKVSLKCLDVDVFEEVPFGHHFPEESNDIQALFERHGADAAEWFVKRYLCKDRRLERLPDVTYQAVISVEGDLAKRGYNRMIRERIRGDRRKYKVADRYGLWLCKDFIPVQRVNEWISGFGSGSNSFVLLHGFINCQTLKLTANRGSIANTDPKVVTELSNEVQRLVSDIDTDLYKNGVYTLIDWQNESRTLAQERAEFDKRTKNVSKRKTAKLEGRILLEPRNESELFGLLITICAVCPDAFEFEPLDYNTTRGIDIVARNKNEGPVTESTYWYVELKYLLKGNFNHAFRNLRWIVCWEFEEGIAENSEFRSIEETDIRQLKVHRDAAGRTSYFLDNPGLSAKIQVIHLRSFLTERLGLVFE